jgi:ribosomal protein L11 methyltransferase
MTDSDPNDTTVPTAWQVEITVLRRDMAIFENVLAAADSVSSTVAGDDAWHLRAIFTQPPPRAAIEASVAIAATAAMVAPPRLSIAPLADKDWIAEGLKHLDAVKVGRFIVRGGHIPPSQIPGRLDLLVDAGQAFGTGHHGTSAGCLVALDRLSRRRQFANPLDMGCGTGVLAMAIAHLWKSPVLAVDIDPVSISVTRENARANHLARLIRAEVSNGYQARIVRTSAPFDLIVANILARPLEKMAPTLARALAPGGAAVLSGILVGQERAVINAHRRCGLRLEKQAVREGWVTLTLYKRGRHT